MFKIINTHSDKVIARVESLDGAHLLACFLSTKTTHQIAVYDNGRQVSRFLNGVQMAEINAATMITIRDVLYTAGLQYDKN